jgi:hypothetical protein
VVYTRTRTPARLAEMAPRGDPDRTSEQARALARLLDTAFRVPGTRFRFGIDPLLGLLPGLGDVLGGFLSGYILFIGVRVGAPRAVLLRMLANVAIDTFFGAVPLVGDVLDAGWKANSRNVALLQKYLEQPRATASASRAFVAFLFLALALLIAGTIVLAVLLARWLFGLIG